MNSVNLAEVDRIHRTMTYLFSSVSAYRDNAETEEVIISQ